MRSVYMIGKVKFSASVSMLVNAREMFTSASEILLCQTYEQSVVKQQLYKVTQHVIGSKHIATIIGLKNWLGR